MDNLYSNTQNKRIQLLSPLSISHAKSNLSGMITGAIRVHIYNAWHNQLETTLTQNDDWDADSLLKFDPLGLNSNKAFITAKEEGRSLRQVRSKKIISIVVVKDRATPNHYVLQKEVYKNFQYFQSYFHLKFSIFNRRDIMTSSYPSHIKGTAKT